jgi:hypothetical protein
MGRLAAPEAHLDLDFVALLEKATRGTHAHLEIVIVGARPQPHLLDLRNVLVLLGVAGALILFKLEFAEIGDTAHRRIGRRRDFDQVQAGLFSAADRLLDG